MKEFSRSVLLLIGLLLVVGCGQQKTSEFPVSTSEEIEEKEIVDETKVLEVASEESTTEDVSGSITLSENVDTELIERILLPKAVYYFENKNDDPKDIRVAETYYAFEYPYNETPEFERTNQSDEYGCYIFYVKGDIFRMMMETLQDSPLSENESTEIDSRIDYDKDLDRYTIHMGDGWPYVLQVRNVKLNEEKSEITVTYDLIDAENLDYEKPIVKSGEAVLVANTNELAQSLGYIYAVHYFQ